MFRILCILCLLCGGRPLAAQQHPRLLRFVEPEHDLGRIREVDGTVTLRYEFTNISDRAVTLLDVHTQCGCLQPRYDRRPVQSGGRGVIEVTFDPKGRWGDFSIGLTVISTNGDYKKFNTLKARGYVVSRVPEEEIRYPYRLTETIRADVGAVGMRQLGPQDGPRTRQIRLFNTTDRELKASYDSGDRNLTMSGPDRIEARSEAVVEFVLDPRRMPEGEFTIRSAVHTSAGDIPIEVRGVILPK